MEFHGLVVLRFSRLGAATSALALHLREVYSCLQERGGDMDRDYDIFERFPDASVRCLIRVHGTGHVPKVLEERQKHTTNECFAINVRTREIIARVNDKVARRVQLIKHLVHQASVKPVR